MPCTRERTMLVDTSAIGTPGFGASRQKKRQVLDNGRAAARQFLSGWDWRTTLERCGRRP
jgi:hypothetical protein